MPVGVVQPFLDEAIDAGACGIGDIHDNGYGLQRDLRAGAHDMGLYRPRDDLGQGERVQFRKKRPAGDRADLVDRLGQRGPDHFPQPRPRARARRRGELVELELCEADELGGPVMQVGAETADRVLVDLDRPGGGVA
ncbi:hypothetical protein ASE63_23075 [Bosea sp. Root381]|nr:hypothetical protein ASE63_23075 [Bosea sp. Root381]